MVTTACHTYKSIFLHPSLILSLGCLYFCNIKGAKLNLRCFMFTPHNLTIWYFFFSNLKNNSNNSFVTFLEWKVYALELFFSVYSTQWEIKLQRSQFLPYQLRLLLEYILSVYPKQKYSRPNTMTMSLRFTISIPYIGHSV